MTFYLLIFSYNYCILSQCTSIISFFIVKKEPLQMQRLLL
ncbi:hypothetical protein HMPREF0373_01549 [Eubacterium ramulus ATCC 29099]|uniref:Uncharacterized protein n=1 Tax=Eubacterium ramulus ATCC 29099 TaxID=1256908 RepID=U2PSD3_EUBRA|nr:hypothetical protein HMPREF0373_01549 [Eubacterium ramulus ATCC 29099]